MSKSLFSLIAVLSAQSVLSQPKNVQVSADSISRYKPEEVSIALDPSNQADLAVGSNNNLGRWAWLYTTTDAGLSWQTRDFAPHNGGFGDPTLVFDNDGYLYYGTLGGPALGVVRSSDMSTFDTGSPVGASAWPQIQDKPTIVADRRHGSTFLSLAWTRFDTYDSRKQTDSSSIRCSVSSDHGLTWSNAVRVDAQAGDCIDSSNTTEGAVTAFGQDGELYIVWSAKDTIYFSMSSDSGKTFEKQRAIAEQPAGWWIPAKNVGRANGFPVMVCDQNGPFSGRLYVTWGDTRRGKPDVYFIVSTDRGVSWSEAQCVTAQDTNRHLFPAMALDEQNGDVHIVYYSMRANDTTDVFLTSSSDGGETFSTQQVSDRSFLAKTFIGDYIAVAAYNSRVYPVWTRVDGITTSIWTALITITSDVVREQHDNFHLSLGPDGVLHFIPGAIGGGHLELFDALGRLLYQSALDERDQTIPLSGLNTGLYLARITYNGRTSVRKFVY